jgi:hypothetical protein
MRYERSPSRSGNPPPPHRYSMDRRLGGPPGRSGRREKKKIFVPAGNRTPAIQLFAFSSCFPRSRGYFNRPRLCCMWAVVLEQHPPPYGQFCIPELRLSGLYVPPAASELSTDNKTEKFRPSNLPEHLLQIQMCRWGHAVT